jgi:hypothetical protein
VAIGRSSGYYCQGHGAVAVGKQSGYCNQGCNSVAIGNYAGQYNQGSEAVAIGYYAGGCDQGIDAVAIGNEAGYRCQGDYAVAIGHQAGYGDTCCGTPQGDYSVAIGYQAGYLSQVANSIAINASIDSLNPGEAGLFINPVRANASSISHSLYYNTATKEITYADPVAVSLPQNLQNSTGDYTLALSDAGKHVYKTGTGNVYIDISANIAFPIGSVVTLVTSANSTTIQPVNSGVTTLILSKFGADASINVPADTYVTMLKVETDKWMIQT